MPAASSCPRVSKHRWFRVAVVVGSALAAVVGSVLLARNGDGERVTTRGISAALRVPAHPGSIVAVTNALWVALNGDPGSAAGDRPLIRLDLATGSVAKTVHLGGEVSSLSRVGDRLIASVEPVGGTDSGPRRLVALDPRSGVVLSLGQSHLDDAAARSFGGPVERVVRAGNALWALETRPATLLQLDPLTLRVEASIRLSRGAALGLAAGGGYVWVTVAGAREVLRVDTGSGAIRRVHVGGFPVGIVVAGGQVWLADRAHGAVIRLDPRTLGASGAPVHVGGGPSSLAAAGGVLYVGDREAGTVARVDPRSGRTVGPPIRVAPPAKGAVAPVLTSSGTSVWVSDFASDTLTRITSPVTVSARSAEVTLAGTGDGPVNPGPNGTGVTDGGVAGTGRFTIRGAIDDEGTYVGYRSVEGETAKVTTVAVGRHGTITFVTTIRLGTESSARWAITSGTKSYAGLHGKGRVTVDNYESNPYTFVMKGTVSR